MNRREDPRDPLPRRPTPMSRPPQQPRGGPKGPHSAPPQRPTRPPAGRPEEPWYLEFRRPPAPPPSPSPSSPAARRPPPAHQRPPAPGTAPTPPALKRPSNRALLIATGVSVLLAATVLSALALRGGVGLGLSGPVQLDVLAAQDGVARVLADPVNGYGRDGVTAVRCNNGVNPTVRTGATFTCVVTVDGAQRQVLVEFADDAGTYRVDRPR